MIVDTSALCAIVFDEPEALAFSVAIKSASDRWVSAATSVELVTVISRRTRHSDPMKAARLLFDDLGLRVLPVDEEQSVVASQALVRYGRGRSRAGLNLGDAFAYAAAKATGRPLLFKGDDFTHTDIASAL